jgi:tetratricopeptide (TPR) repeat protein
MIKRKTAFFLAAALVTALAAAGCNLNNTQPPQVVATASGETTEAPSPTATATIMPTATVAPALTLNKGDSALLNGRFEDAAAAYTILVRQAGAPAYDRATAVFGVGQAALRGGMFAQALDTLTSFIQTFPQDTRIAQAHYLRGDANLGLSRWNDAISDFQTYLSLRPGVIDSYAQERIGDAQLALGQTDNALASYTQAASDPARGLGLRERIAQVMASAGRSADAVAQDDALLKTTTSEADRAEIAFQAAQIVVAAGDMQNGLVRMMQVFNNYPDRPEAYQAMNILLRNNVELDNIARGQVSYNYGDYQGAIDALNLFTEAHTVDQIPASLLLLLGQAYAQIGNVQAALTSFQTILDHYTTDPLFGDALLNQGQARALNNDSSGAIEQYMHIADVYDYLDQAPEALWRAA